MGNKESKRKANDLRSADAVGFFMTLELVVAVVVGIGLLTLRFFDVI